MEDRSDLILRLPRSGIREAAALAGGRSGLAHLEFGEPDALTPEVIRKAAAKAIMEQRMVYTPTEGPGELRAAISQKLLEVNGDRVDPDEVFVTHGGIGGIFVALGAILNPGDGVMLPDPGWPNTVSISVAFGARPHFYPLDAQNGYLPDPDGWDIPGNTKVISLNSPSNPTGSVFPEDLTKRIVEIARKRGLWILSDEVYDQIYYDRKPVAVRPLYPERTVSIYSFSKTYAMTGWRLGYFAGPYGMAERVASLAETTYTSTSAVAQVAALAALREAGPTIPGMVRSYRERRDAALKLLETWGMKAYTPEGAFYLMVDVSEVGEAGDVARRLVEEKGVVTVPGTAFGEVTRGAIRISLASSLADIRRGLEAVRDLLVAAGAHHS